MKHFFALPALLRTAALYATASQHAFSVQDDLLAFPQYDVILSDEWISEEAAQFKMLSDVHRDVQDLELLQQSPPHQNQKYQQTSDARNDGDGKDSDKLEYERMTLDGQQWLCGIPKVQKAVETAGTNDTLTKAEEEKELARATDRGWELLSGMQGNCVFFISGWWSYRFCYNQDVKQFHQLPPSRGVPVYPPIEDPGVPGFMLGTYAKRVEHEDQQSDSWESANVVEVSEGAKRKRTRLGELVQRGESRYLVQRLGGGTVCDLTGEERKVEVQFHCNPQSADLISLIKETSTCHYLMVIQTPRLCNDVAFLPPQKDQPNVISCSIILREEEVASYERDLQALRASELEAKTRDAMAQAAAALEGSTLKPNLPVGDIYVGERRLVPEGQTIEKSGIVGGGKETYIDTVASSDGKILPKEQLEKLGLGDPKKVDELKKQLEKIAQGQNWKLDVIDTPQGREYRGIIGEDEEHEKNDEKGGKETKGKGSTRGSGDDKKTPGKKGNAEPKHKNVQGSQEEYYHEEM